jgi:hypothetical protein
MLVYLLLYLLYLLNVPANMSKKYTSGKKYQRKICEKKKE